MKDILIQRLKKHDEAAFEEVMNKYLPLVSNIVPLEAGMTVLRTCWEFAYSCHFEFSVTETVNRWMIIYTAKASTTKATYIVSLFFIILFGESVISKTSRTRHDLS